jgi:phage tail sheath gpL-like
VADIPITGVPSSFLKPGNYVEILVAQGAGTSATDERNILIAMPVLSTGTATALRRYQVRTASEVEALAGSGSNAHRAARKLFAANTNARVTYLAVALTTGGIPVAANLDVPFTGTITAGTQGKAEVFVGGEACEYSFSAVASDTITTIAAGIKAAINDKTWLPVTADNAAGVLTITHRQVGIAGGDGTTGVVRVHVDITSGTGISVATENGGVTDALGLGTAVDGADGTTTQAAQLASALATVANESYYYVLTDAWDATGLGNVQTHVANKTEPRTGKRATIIAGFTGTEANGATLATGLNYERLALAILPEAENDIAEMVGSCGGAIAKEENLDKAMNFDGYVLDLLPPFDPLAHMSGDDINDALVDGLMPLEVTRAGRVAITMATTTRSKTASGANNDRRALERHRISVADHAADQIEQVQAVEFAGKKLKSDKLNRDGSVDTTQKLNAKVVTPSNYRKRFTLVIRDLEDSGLIQDADVTIAAFLSQRDPQNTGRIENALPLRAIDLFHQATWRISEFTPG